MAVPAIAVPPAMYCSYCVEIMFVFPSEPPSPVTNVQIQSDSVTLVWDPPVNFGGRNDTVYVLFYQEEGSSRHVEAVTVHTTMGTIIGIS